jgi:hypothetical protein
MNVKMNKRWTNFSCRQTIYRNSTEARLKNKGGYNEIPHHIK